MTKLLKNILKYSKNYSLSIIDGNRLQFRSYIVFFYDGLCYVCKYFDLFNYIYKHPINECILHPQFLFYLKVRSKQKEKS